MKRCRVLPQPTASVSSPILRDDSCLALLTTAKNVDRDRRSIRLTVMLKLFGSRIRADVILGILLFHFLSFFASVTALSITSDPAQVVNKTFTHVVVGGGTAGQISVIFLELTRLLI